MLEQSIVEGIVHCTLSDEQIRHHLLDLEASTIDSKTIGQFVTAVRAMAEAESVAAFNGLEDSFDCSGTGGSGKIHYNVSTMAAFVLSAGGVRVAKFGNRSSKGANGSFDFLESLGLPVELEPLLTRELIEKTNLGFLFAPQYYPALAKLRNIRKSIPGSTVFNLIGPLLNPAKPVYRVLGTFDIFVQNILAQYLVAQPETRHALVVRSETGLDELDPRVSNHILEIRNNNVESFSIVVHENSIAATEEKALTARDNAIAFNELLEGNSANSFLKQLLCLNSGAGFTAAGKSKNIDEGVACAEDLLRTGAVKAKLEEFRRACAVEYSR